MPKKKMTDAARAKKIREMADSVTVRNHLFTLVNTGRVDKVKRQQVMKFLDYIDTELLNGCLQMLPDDVEVIKPASTQDFVQAREKKTAEVAATKKQAAQATETEEHSKGVFKRVQ